MKCKNVAATIIEDFETKIKNGQLKKGDRLPNENEYAKQLGVSRGSLREAMKTLQAMGAVSQKPKVGIKIVCDNPNLWIRHLNIAKSILIFNFEFN